jgi:hypothetical protein
MATMNVNFDTKEEYAKKLQIFIANDKKIEAHNSLPDSLFKMSHN